MKPMWFKGRSTHPVARLISLVAGLTTMWILVGCETLTGYSDQQEARWQAELADIREQMQKLNGRIEGVELEVDRLKDTIRSACEGESQSAARFQSLDNRLRELEAKLARVDAAREQDKKELIDRLSAKIAEIMSRSVPARTSAAGGAPAASPKSSRKGALTGYEHEVKPGETLSAIAAAYGVSVKTILEYNDIPDPNKLRVGQKLFIPE